VDEGNRPVYRGLYFNLTRDEDLEILGWLLAIPRWRRMRAIKAVLRTGLAGYAAERHPDLKPLPPDAVRAACGADRPRPLRARGVPAHPATLVSAAPPRGTLTAVRLEPDPEPSRTDHPGEPRVVAETKLDRLLQSFVR
jgi:hypothetical protein